MRTLIIYNSLDRPIEFAIISGDHSHLNGVNINSCEEDPEREKEAIALLYKEGTGELKFPVTTDTSLAESKEWDKIAVITFLP